MKNVACCLKLMKKLMKCCPLTEISSSTQTAKTKKQQKLYLNRSIKKK